MKLFLSLAAVSGFLAVAIGAFGAHVVKSKIPLDMLEVYETGARYQMYHSLALFGVAILLRFFPGSVWFSWAGWLFVAGTLIFSGSLYALSLSGIHKLGAITPIGGLCFLAGWAMLLVGAMKIEF